MSDRLTRFNKIKNQFDEFKSNPKNKNVRIKDVADRLSLSEGELLSSRIGDNIFYLKVSDFNIFFEKILLSKKIMTLIRSEFVVHEKILNTSKIKINNNSFVDLSNNSSAILLFDKQIFKHVFYQKMIHNKKELKSFQIFDSTGRAVLKIYDKANNSNIFDEVCEEYKITYKYEMQELNNKIIDVMKNIDLKDFFCKNNSISKKKLVSEKNKISLRDTLEYFVQNQIPIKIYARGNGTTQYHCDFIKNIVDFGVWINVIDKKFNIHINEDKIIKSIFIKDSINEKFYYSIEYFDISGEHVMGISFLEKFETKFNKMIVDLKGYS